jgi:hypothetical protein
MATFTLWRVIPSVRAGVWQINRSLAEVARSFGATPLDAFRKSASGLHPWKFRVRSGSASSAR